MPHPIRLACLALAVPLLTGCSLYQRRTTTEPISLNDTIYHPIETTVTDTPTEAIPVPVIDPYLGTEITFLATGDNLIHPNIYIDARSRGSADKTYDFLPLYADVAEQIGAVDYAFINQETVMAGEGYGYSGYPHFNSPRQLGLDLVTLGFDVIGLANNHMLDMGAQGLADSTAFWRSQPVTAIGALDGSAPAITEKDGVKIGWLAYTYGTNSYAAPATSPVQVPYINREAIKADIDALRQEGAVAMVVSVHWGVENTHTPNEEQKELAQFLADEGVDVILGHHSHCIQPIEWLPQPDGTETLCIYSLGNCVSGMERPMNMVGGLFTFTLTGDGDGGMKAVAPLFTPTVFFYGPGWYNTHVYLLEDYTEEIAASHGVAMHGYRLTPADAFEMVSLVMDREFLPDWMTEGEGMEQNG